MSKLSFESRVGWWLATPDIMCALLKEIHPYKVRKETMKIEQEMFLYWSPAPGMVKFVDVGVVFTDIRGRHVAIGFEAKESGRWYPNTVLRQLRYYKRFLKEPGKIDDAETFLVTDDAYIDSPVVRLVKSEGFGVIDPYNPPKGVRPMEEFPAEADPFPKRKAA